MSEVNGAVEIKSLISIIENAGGTVKERLSFIEVVIEEKNPSKKRKLQSIFVKEYKGTVWGVVNKLIKYLPLEVREDIVQEVWIKIFSKLQQCNENPVGWIAAISRNEVINLFSSAKYKKHRGVVSLDKPVVCDDGDVYLIDALASSDRFYTSVEVFRDIECGFRNIDNPDIRKTFELDCLGYSGKKIAETLGVEQSTVRTRLHKNRKIVKDYLIGIGYSASDIA
jgi:RNA polymerase sigma factor (sigma-70 family)